MYLFTIDLFLSLSIYKLFCHQGDRSIINYRRMTLRLQIYQFEVNAREAVRAQLYVTGSRAGPLLSSPTLSVQEHKWNPPFIVDCSQQDHLELSLYSIQREEIGRTTLSCLPFIEQETNAKIFPSKESVKYQLTLSKSDRIIGCLRLLIYYEPALLFEGQFSMKVNLSLRIGHPAQGNQKDSQSFQQRRLLEEEASSFEKQLQKNSKEPKPQDLIRESKVFESKQIKEDTPASQEYKRVDRQPSKINRQPNNIYGQSGRIQHQPQLAQKKLSSLINKDAHREEKGEKNVHLYLGKCPTVNAFSFFDGAINGQTCSFSEPLYRDKQ